MPLAQSTHFPSIQTGVVGSCRNTKSKPEEKLNQYGQVGVMATTIWSHFSSHNKLTVVKYWKNRLFFKQRIYFTLKTLLLSCKRNQGWKILSDTCGLATTQNCYSASRQVGFCSATEWWHARWCFTQFSSPAWQKHRTCTGNRFLKDLISCNCNDCSQEITGIRICA